MRHFSFRHPPSHRRHFLSRALFCALRRFAASRLSLSATFSPLMTLSRPSPEAVLTLELNCPGKREVAKRGALPLPPVEAATPGGSGADGSSMAAASAAASVAPLLPAGGAFSRRSTTQTVSTVIKGTIPGGDVAPFARRVDGVLRPVPSPGGEPSFPPRGAAHTPVPSASTCRRVRGGVISEVRLMPTVTQPWVLQPRSRRRNVAFDMAMSWWPGAYMNNGQRAA